MKGKRFLCLFIALTFSFSAFTAFAAIEADNDRIKVFYDNEIIKFDVDPIIENGRTLVPMRSIFEAMGCAVYYSEENGKQLVSARRAKDNLFITIGENKMYFNNNAVELDVPAKIKDGRTLLPLRAISEAFESEVVWNGDTKTIYIYSQSSAYVRHTKKISETITDDEGNVLIEVVAYYPVFENATNLPCLDAINSDYNRDIDKFVEEARTKKEDALMLRKERGEAFTPFVYEHTYEQTYTIWGYLSFVNYKYVNIGGAHPSVIMESKTYGVNSDAPLTVSNVINEDELDTSLTEFVTSLFVDKLKEIAPQSSEIYTSDYVREYLGYVQFYLTKNSLVLYFGQGEITPYALGTVSVEIPYEPGFFTTDMRHNYEQEHVFEYEYDNGYEWKIVDYSKEKLVVTEKSTDYPPEKIYSKYYPVGLYEATVKGIKKGNAAVILAHVKKGEEIETAKQIYIASFYVDEDNMLTLVTEDDGMFLKGNVVYPLPETLDVNTLDNCIVPVSLEKGSVYVDNNGKVTMDVVIYSYELYDMVDIASLKEGDVIVRRCEEIKVTEIERLQSGHVRINGGEENGGFDLISNDSTVYYETGMNDIKAYYELCKVSLPVSDEFEYVDASDLDEKEKHYSIKDLITETTGIDFGFYPSNTSIVIENGTVVKMNKVYTP